MQENSEFDLFIKRTMHDGEAEVPPHVWQGIESRLAALDVQKTAASPRHTFRWGWAAAGLAMAAAIAAALFFTGTNSNLINHTNGNSMIAELPAVPEIKAESAQGGREEVLPSERQIPLMTRSNGIKAVSVQPVADAVVMPFQAGEEQVQEDSDPAVPVRQEPVTVQEKEAPAPEQESFSHEDFSRLAFDDKNTAKSNIRISAVAGGSIGGNGTQGGRTIYGAHQNESYIPHEITESGSSSYSVPLTFGLGTRLRLSPRFSVGTGVDYSLLSRTFSGTYNDGTGSPVSSDIRNTLQYIGIPLNLYFNITTGGSVRFYMFGGGEAEWPIRNSFRILSTGDVFRDKFSGTQFSAGAGFGVEFRITDKLGFYIDPSARYYFNGNQPKSIRTEQPFLLNFNAGLRMEF